MNPKGKLTKPSVLLLKIVVLHVRRRLQSWKGQFWEILNPDRPWKHFYQTERIAVVVDAWTVVRRPNLEHCHAAGAQTFMRKKFQTNIACSVCVNFIIYLGFTEIGSVIFLIYSKWLEILILFPTFHLVEMVHDPQRSIVKGIPIRSHQRMMQCELQLSPIEISIPILVLKWAICKIRQVPNV